MNAPDNKDSQDALRARRLKIRNLAVFGALALFVLLVYGTTMVKIKMTGVP